MNLFFEHTRKLIVEWVYQTAINQLFDEFKQPILPNLILTLQFFFNLLYFAWYFRMCLLKLPQLRFIAFQSLLT